MAKLKTQYICQNCGATSSKWLGRCTECEEWNTFVEEVVAVETKKSQQKSKLSGVAKKEQDLMSIADIEHKQESRLVTKDAELNRVLGSGIVAGSVILIGGEPGIGKSTLMLQLAVNMLDCKILYVSGEESSQQIKMRADRLGIQNRTCYILTETNLYNIFKKLKKREIFLLYPLQRKLFQTG